MNYCIFVYFVREVEIIKSVCIIIIIIIIIIFIIIVINTFVER